MVDAIETKANASGDRMDEIDGGVPLVVEGVDEGSRGGMESWLPTLPLQWLRGFPGPG